MEEKKTPIYKKWWFIALVILFGLPLVCAPFMDIEPTEEQSQEPTAEQQEEPKNTEPEKTPLSEEAAEKECQDAKYYKDSNIYKNNVDSIISVSDYNLSIVRGGTYDADGNNILGVYWNGKNKNGDLFRFECYISGNNDNDLTVHYIAGNLKDIWKTYADLEHNSYDKDGNRIEK